MTMTMVIMASAVAITAAIAAAIAKEELLTAALLRLCCCWYCVLSWEQMMEYLGIGIRMATQGVSVLRGMPAQLG